MNLYPATIKFEYIGTEVIELEQTDYLYINDNTILVQIPDAKNIEYYNERRLKISVSNNKVNYSPETVYFTYMEEPTLISITNNTSDFEGGKTCQIIGTHFTNDVTECVFGST